MFTTKHSSVAPIFVPSTVAPVTPVLSIPARLARAIAALAAILALVALCALASATGALAGKYHVYSCRMPNGEVAPTDGWSGTPSTTTDPTYNTCSTSGALIAGLSDDSVHETNTDVATWVFDAPHNETIAEGTLWRAGDTEGGMATNATYEFWLAGPNEADDASDVFSECVYEFGCQLGLGDQAQPMSSTNRVSVPVENLGEHMYVNASCGGVAKFKCPSGKGDPNGYAAVVYLYAADLVLEQTSQPTVSGVEGELATAATLSGTADLSLHAEDPGSGVYEAVFTVDGTETGSVLLDENGGHCRNVGQTTDGLPAFLYLQPCPPSLSADIPFNTTALTDGTHHLVVTVTNAAGNSTVALDRKITVSNDPQVSMPSKESSASNESPASKEPASKELPVSKEPSAQSGDGDSPTTTGGNDQLSQNNPAPQSQSDNGTGASAGATLHVRWSATAHTALAGASAHAQTAVGQLTAPSGAPIAGALVRVLSTPSYEGAHTHTLAPVRTASDGSFRVRLPAGTPSSRITFAYSASTASVVPNVTAVLTLAVSANLVLRVTPRTSRAGGTIVFTGTLRGAHLPPGGKTLVLEARADGAGSHSLWRQFQVLTTRVGGRFRASYRFRLPGPITYQFRAVSPAEADFPYAAGASNVVRVLER